MSFPMFFRPLVLLALLYPTPVLSTWSILAVDRDTGQVGAAGASCTWCVYGIAALQPGVGGVIVQAMSNAEAREVAIGMLRDGATSEQVMAAIRDTKYDPENQQYAVITLDDPPVVYSGKDTSDWSGEIVGADYSAQGNILAGETVLTEAVAAFEAARDLPLPDRLLAALRAGAVAGGDRRCGDQYARSAFVKVFDRDNARGEPYVNIAWYGIDAGADPAVDRLAEEFERWKEHGAHLRSTRRFIVQGRGR